MLGMRMLLVVPFSFNTEHTTKLQLSLAEYPEGQSPELGFLSLYNTVLQDRQNHVPYVVKKWNVKVIQASSLKENALNLVCYNSL